MRDRWTITNHSSVAWAGVIRLEVDADFADLAEVGRERQQHGELDVRVRGLALELRYVARRGERRFDRGVRVRLDAGSWPAQVRDPHLEVSLQLPGRGSARFGVTVGSLVDGRWRTPRSAAAPGGGRARSIWRTRRTQVEAPERLRAPFERAMEDLRSLRNADLERDLLGEDRGPSRGWILNAGVPTFTGFFGRDALTAGWQAALGGPEALIGALEVAARTQATEDDPWRDAEPGKMIHELRRGPLAMLGISPRDAYYGSQTTSSMFVIALSEAWHWTGDDDLLRRFREPALRAIEWADLQYASEGPASGFMTYEKRSSAGLRNQGWKDSDEAIRHADGTIAEPPIATVEEQAFHFLALQRMGELLVALGEDERAEDCLQRSGAIRSRFHEAFWMGRESYYAVALDRDGSQVESITSNPGHALATGIVPAQAARQVADRLLSRTLFNGWGVRTLASDHPSYNPLAYHLGTVWPVENATFALAFKRYGLDDHLDRLVGAMLEAAAASPRQRLPEALTGHHREASVPPAAYPNACAPQAWSASAVIQMVQLMLGLYPFAPLRILALVRPRLPASIPELTLRNVRVGRATVDLRFTRRRDGSASHKVVRSDGTLRVVPAGPPVDVSGQGQPWFEAIEREVLQRAPGRLVRAARIAIGLE